MKALMSGVARQIQRLYMRIKRVEAERDALKARLIRVEASAARMRDVLEEAISVIELLHPMNSNEPCDIYEVWEKCKAILASSDAGCEILENLKRLKARVKTLEYIIRNLGVSANDQAILERHLREMGVGKGG